MNQQVGVLEREELVALKMPELRSLMQSIGGSVDQSETKESLINRLLLQSAQQPRDEEDDNNEDKEGTELRVRVEAPTVTPEQLKKAVGRFVLRGMEVYHNAKDLTWLFRVKLRPHILRNTNTGAIQQLERWANDSGTLRQPIETIVMCAAKLMQQAPKPVAKEQERDSSKGLEKLA